jgi:hypothetical protein
MPTYDLDEESTLFEPLKIKVGGKELIIKDVARKEFEKIADINLPCEQLARWANVDVKEIEEISMKKVAAALTIIAKEFLGPAARDFTPKKA